MKRLFAIISLLSIISSHQLFAQTGFEQLINAGPADATKLVDAYSKSLFKGFGLGMNSGWTNSAQTLGLSHFELRVTGTGVIVPASGKSFDVTRIGLSSNLRPANPNDVISPSFSGSTRANGPLMDVYDENNNKLVSFELPSGMLENYVPTPQIQLTVGLPANTDVTIRAAPRFTIGRKIGSVSLIGFGIKHNFMRDLSKDAPFDLALAFSYNNLKYKKSLYLQPLENSVPQDSEQSTDFSGQEIFGNFNNYLFQALISKQFSVFTPYLSLGYNVSSADMGLSGNYPIISGYNGDQVTYKTFSNPVRIERTYLKDFRVDAGFQVKLPIVRFYASYGVSGNYGIANAGIGIGL